MTIESSGLRGVHKSEYDLLHGRKEATNIQELQIKLAIELYDRKARSNHQGPGEFDIQTFIETDEGKTAVMETWGNDGYSVAIRKFVEDLAFLIHPRFKGDFHNITLSDVEYYIIAGHLPRE